MAAHPQRLTADREPVLVSNQIGRTRHLTPEGFLYCEDVRIARVGTMLYRTDEVPDIDPGTTGTIVIERGADVLFSPDTIASFNGKPVTNGHPPDFVTPSTWQQYSAGTVLNTRRGEGVEADYLIADLLITDARAIADVQAGKREVSCGYDAPRETIKPGYGRQTSMIGNHVALVDRGRAGPACAIQDEHSTTEANMAGKKRSIVDRLRTAFKANDADAFEEELSSVEPDGDEPQRIVIEVAQPAAAAPAEEPKVDDEGDTPDPIAALGAKLDAIAEMLAKALAPKAEDEEPAKEEEPQEQPKPDAPAMDEATIADIRSKAEILAPGIDLPTLDAKASPADRTAAAMGLRVRALTKAYANDKTKGYVATALGGASADFAAMTADHIGVLFNASAALVANGNKAGRQNIDHQAFPQGPVTAAELAKRYKKAHGA